VSESIQPQDVGFRWVRLRCECDAVLARLQRRDGKVHVRLTGGKRVAPLSPIFSSAAGRLDPGTGELMAVNWRPRCRCGRVYLLGRDQQAFNRTVMAAMTLAEATGSADVYLDDIAQPAKAIFLTE
jgi:hypothetical protein